jgi:hypothetical protein
MSMAISKAASNEGKASSSKTLPKVIAVLVVLLIICVVVAYSNNNDIFSDLASILLSVFSKKVSNGQRPAIQQSATTIPATLSTNSTSADSQLTQVAGCVNLDLRMRAASYLNNSVVQQDMAYCQHYNYNPPGNNYTTLCTYIQECVSRYG